MFSRYREARWATGQKKPAVRRHVGMVLIRRWWPQIQRVPMRRRTCALQLMHRPQRANRFSFSLSFSTGDAGVLTGVSIAVGKAAPRAVGPPTISAVDARPQSRSRLRSDEDVAVTRKNFLALPM